MESATFVDPDAETQPGTEFAPVLGPVAEVGNAAATAAKTEAATLADDVATLPDFETPLGALVHVPPTPSEFPVPSTPARSSGSSSGMVEVCPFMCGSVSRQTPDPVNPDISIVLEYPKQARLQMLGYARCTSSRSILGV
jgi:hypothetical protein